MKNRIFVPLFRHMVSASLLPLKQPGNLKFCKSGPIVQRIERKFPKL